MYYVIFSYKGCINNNNNAVHALKKMLHICYIFVSSDSENSLETLSYLFTQNSQTLISVMPYSLHSLFLINLIIFIHLDSLEHLQRHSASLSSDDVVGLSHESSTLSQASLLPRSSTLPFEATPQSRSAPRTTCPRPRSPGSEMVTLEEFLQESNTLSPPTVRTHEEKCTAEWPFKMYTCHCSFVFIIFAHSLPSFKFTVCLFLPFSINEDNYVQFKICHS